MNIVKYELKTNLKNFLWWMLGIGIIMLLSMVKFEGLNAPGVDISKMFEAFPKIVLIIFGMNNLDITTLAGYIGVLFSYLFIAGSLYAIRLGSNTTALEINNKTADFIYAKPISRLRITLLKQLSGLLYIIIFVIATYLFTFIGILMIGENPNVNSLITLSVVLFTVMVLYYACSALLSSLSHKTGSLYANLLLLSSFIILIMYQMLELKVLKFLSPLAYFDISEIVKNNHMDVIFTILSLVIIIITLTLSNAIIMKKNLD